MRGDEGNPFGLVIGETACQIAVLVYETVFGHAASGPGTTSTSATRESPRPAPVGRVPH